MHALRLFQTAAEATRLRLLGLLSEREMNVQELETVLEMGQSRISHHLKLMREAGLVSCRRDGLWSFYRATQDGPGRRFLDSVGYLLHDEPLLQADRRLAAQVLREGRRRTRRFFDALADHWEALRGSVLGGADLAGTVESLLPACAAGADLGCGSGALLGTLARKARVVIGVDSSRRMLEEARRRLAGQGLQADLRIGELEHLPLRDAEAGWAVINLVLHHLSEPALALAESARVLAARGTLVVADFRRHGQEWLRRQHGDRWLGFEPADLEGWLRQAGFTVARPLPLPVRHGLTVMVYRCVKRNSRTSRTRRGATDG